MLAFLESLIPPAPNEVSKKMAADFRKRRIEKGLTREAIALQSGVAIANVSRFEQKGLISLTNLIKLATALGYLSELQNVFSAPKYSTMDELLQICRNIGKKKAHTAKPKKNEKD